MRHRHIRIGFDDERARDAVYLDMIGGGHADLVGVWKPGEWKFMMDTRRLMRAIETAADRWHRELMRLDEAVDFILRARGDE